MDVVDFSKKNMKNYLVRKDGKQLLTFFLKETLLPSLMIIFEDVLNVNRQLTFAPHILLLDVVVEAEEEMKEEENVLGGCPPGDMKLLQVMMPPKR